MSRADQWPTKDRLYIQTLRLTAAGDDLRQFRGDAEFREIVHTLRDVRADILWRHEAWRDRSRIFDASSDFEWAIERAKVRLGISSNTWWATGQELDRHDYAADLRLIIQHIEATS